MSERINQELFEAGYEIAKNVLNGEVSKSDAKAELMRRFDLPDRTADGYWRCYFCMKLGEKVRNTIKVDAWRFNLEKVEAEGALPFAFALQVVREHIVYQQTKPKPSMVPGLVALHGEFVKRLASADQLEQVYSSLERRIELASQDTREARQKRLLKAPTTPQEQYVLTRTFIRNADVITEVLARAGGYCETCEQPAPFLRRNGEPYLEVHHVTRLADGGADTVANAIAVCPNCHRRHHYGTE
ncbi:HNH endonuclease [Paraburkholderia caribensis]|uniref:HNH endonuclease n=1 Tax=Paraburkholderia caribensis TaxID=75105 RepID=UPI0020916D55|nr:HNH endonuclease signature motif containing protein [Paraburkholderia caribensis]MCO4879035.1 HNH endonuclease [Paraburkholderia caribensis]